MELALTGSLENKLTRPTSPMLNKVFCFCIANMLIILGAYTSIPVLPVPISLQNFAVIFIGMVFGWRIGLAAVTAYLIEGLMGLPVFANAPLLSPSMGYLLGFLPAVALSGYLMEKGWAKNGLLAILTAVLADGLIFLFGLAGLSILFGFDKAYLLGLKPFLYIEPVKLVVLGVITPFFWKKSNP